MKQKERLRNVAVKYKQVLSNIVNFRMIEIDSINSPIKKLDNKMLYMLIIDMKTISGEKVFLAIKKSQQREYVLQAKDEHEDETSIYASYLAKWLVKLYRAEVLSKFDSDAQELLLSAESREGMLLHLVKWRQKT